MTLLLQAGGSLRRYGEWGELKYQFGPNQVGEALATKRFTWAQKVRSKHAPALEFTLSYFSDAFVDPKRMNDLGYLADQERKALEILVAMVQAAVNGMGYIGIPNPAFEIQKDVVQLMRDWVSQNGYPETWEPEVRRVIDQAFARLGVWKERLQAVQAHVDPEHTAWGIAFEILPPEPVEAPA